MNEGEGVFVGIRVLVGVIEGVKVVVGVAVESLQMEGVPEQLIRRKMQISRQARFIFFIQNPSFFDVFYNLL
ncbi:MAG: hypothetical protein QM730_28240 [Anaerolineales bacterium]